MPRTIYTSEEVLDIVKISIQLGSSRQAFIERGYNETAELVKAMIPYKPFFEPLLKSKAANQDDDGRAYYKKCLDQLLAESS